MQEYLIQLANTHSSMYTYFAIMAIAFVEGPFVTMVGGALLRLGFFSLVPFYFAVAIGDLLGDIAWYYIGRFYGLRFVKRFGKYFDITEDKISKVEHIFHHYKWPILFVSKITNGFGFAIVTLMTAGMVKIPFARYMGINSVGQILWSGTLLFTGYFFSHLYIQINNVFGRISLIAGFAALIYAFTRYRKYLQTKIK